MICREDKLSVEHWKGIAVRREEDCTPLLLSAGSAQADVIRGGSTGREPFCCRHWEVLPGSISIFNVIWGSRLLVQALPFLAHPDGRVGHSCWGQTASGEVWGAVGTALRTQQCASQAGTPLGKIE